MGPVSHFTGRTRALRVYTHFSRNPHNRPEGNGASSPFKHQKAEPLLAKPSAKALGESLDKDLDFTCIHSTNVCWALALGWPYKQHKTSPPAGDLWAHPVPTPWGDEELLGPTGLIASRADSRGGFLETTPPWGAEAPGIRLFSHPRGRGPGTSQLSTAPASLPPSPPPRCPTSAPPPPPAPGSSEPLRLLPSFPSPAILLQVLPPLAHQPLLGCLQEWGTHSLAWELGPLVYCLELPLSLEPLPMPVPLPGGFSPLCSSPHCSGRL